MWEKAGEARKSVSERRWPQTRKTGKCGHRDNNTFTFSLLKIHIRTLVHSQDNLLGVYWSVLFCVEQTKEEWYTVHGWCPGLEACRMCLLWWKPTTCGCRRYCGCFTLSLTTAQLWSKIYRLEVVNIMCAWCLWFEALPGQLIFWPLCHPTKC